MNKDTDANTNSKLLIEFGKIKQSEIVSQISDTLDTLKLIVDALKNDATIPESVINLGEQIHNNMVDFMLDVEGIEANTVMIRGVPIDARQVDYITLRNGKEITIPKAT